MFCIIIDDADLPNAPTKFAPEGYRWAATSNAGLPKGRWRLTFLPESAFTDSPQGTTKNGSPVTGRAPMHVDDFLRTLGKENRDPVIGEKRGEK